MLKLDIPFEETNGSDLNDLTGDGERFPRLRGVMADPIAGLLALAAAFFLIDGTRHVACRVSATGPCGAAEGPLLGLLVLAALVGAGFLLKSAFERYMLRRTQFLAAVIAALPFAHLLAGVHDDSPPEVRQGTEVAELRDALEASEAARSDLALEIAALSTDLDQQAELLARQSAELSSLSADRISEIAAAEAERVLQEESEVFEERLAEQEDDLLSELVERERDQAALLLVARRIADAGPSPRPAPSGSLQPALSEEAALIAEYLDLGAEARRTLAMDDDFVRCVNVRKAERGPFAVMNHRLNPERYAEYLASCAPG